MSETKPTEVVLGSELRNYRQRMRLVPGPLAEALDLTVDELFKIEEGNQPLSAEQVQRWKIFTAVARKRRGHIRRAAPMKELSLPGRREDYLCDKCRLPLVSRDDFFYSPRAGQDVCLLACRTDACSKYDVGIHFNHDGKLVTIPTKEILPWMKDESDYPPCGGCGQPLDKHNDEQDGQHGTSYKLICQNPQCHYSPKTRYFNASGEEFFKGRGRPSKPPFQRRTCAKCGHKMSPESFLHKPTGKRYWREKCKRKGCPRQTLTYDDQGNVVDLKEYLGHSRKYFLPECPDCKKDSVRPKEHCGKSKTDYYAECSICERRFRWSKNAPTELKPTKERRSPVPLPFPSPPCPSCQGQMSKHGNAHHSRRRGKYFYLQCKECGRFSWSNGQATQLCDSSRAPKAQRVQQQTRPTLGGRKRRSEEERERFKVVQSVKKFLPRFTEEMKGLKAIKKLHPEDGDIWRSVLLNRGYSAKEIEDALQSKTPKAAAQRHVARLWGWKLHSVQSACSALWKCM